MNRQYSVDDMSKIVKRNILIIVVLMILGGLCAGLYAKKKQVTTYSAKSLVMVGQNLNHTDYKNSAVQAEMGMMKSYEEVVESDKTISLAHQNLSKHDRKNISESKLKSDISANSHPNSVVLTVTASTDNKSNAVKMANAVAKASVGQIEKYSPLSSNARVLSTANKKTVTSKTHPSAKKYAVLGAALGILIGMIVSFSLTTWKHNN